LSGKQKIISALFIFGYVFTSGVAEAKVFNVIQSVFNAVCGASPAGSPHPSNAPISACGEKPGRLRIPKLREIKRRRSRKKKVPDSRRRKKPFKDIKIVTENPDDKKPGKSRKLRSANAEKSAASKSRNSIIREDRNRIIEHDNTMKFINIIPRQICPAYKMAPSHFTRNGKLPFPKLIIFILSIVASGKSKGVDSKSGAFFKSARRSGLWPDAEAIHRSTLTKARGKVTWKIFENIFYDAVKLAYESQSGDSDSLWHGMSVFAFDGSKYNLPATDAIRKQFDPNSGLENPGRGHYPQALISTAYDVFRRIPVARTVVSMQNADEREEAKRMIPHIPGGGVLLFDRGYPSYDLISFLKKSYSGYSLFRCPAKSTFPAIENFVRSDQNESVIYINPSSNFLKKVDNNKKSEAKPIKLRAIKLVSYDGTLSVLLTDLLSKKKFSAKQIIKLYFRRWEVENHYRDEKIYLEIEKFHTKTCNGIRQELFAVLIMTVISRTLMQLSPSGDLEPQFKNAVMALASEAAVLLPDDPLTAARIFREVLEEIARVKYYRPKIARLSQPRITKKANNKWCKDKVKKSRSP